ncbi:MAG: 2-succinyl-5-enolpyruvyl-6-hydroxy-3-cyclohexene-1-carboxylic-acid synthase [Balneolaceae bacterium]
MADSLTWASTLLRAFFNLGIRHIIVSPGSRSTPLTLAAATHPGFTKRVVLDERSAAYQALGTGKADGVPALLICTSGTALANYLPAVVEAKESGVPIVILSADRPPHLRSSGSSQTIDQIKLFGEQAVWFHEAGEPVHESRDYRQLERIAAQAVESSIRYGGASHVNLPFRKPLEPSANSLSDEKERNRSQLEQQKRKQYDAASRSTVHLSVEILELLNRSQRPLIIGGPGHPFSVPVHSIHSLAEKLQAPLFLEPGSGIPQTENTITGYDQFLRHDTCRRELRPDLILRFGAVPVNHSLQLLLAECRDIPTLQFLSRSGWQDDLYTSDERIFLTGDTLDTEPVKPKKNRWIQSFFTHEQRALERRSELLEQAPTLTDGHIIRHLSRSSGTRFDWMVSNSFPIRDLALFGSPLITGTRIFANRGAAGIDGILSSGLGIQAAAGRPLICLMGDLAFLHDSNALLSAQKVGHPVLVVILNNGGGTIFRMLPVREQEEYFKTYFETPQDVDFQSLARAHGLDYLLVDSLEKLSKIDPENYLEPKTTILECQTDPEASMDLRRALWNG